MKISEYRKYFTETKQLDNKSIMMIHDTILDAQNDPACKVFKNKETVLMDAKRMGWKVAGTAPLPIDAVKVGEENDPVKAAKEEAAKIIAEAKMKAETISEAASEKAPEPVEESKTEEVVDPKVEAAKAKLEEAKAEKATSKKKTTAKKSTRRKSI